MKAIEKIERRLAEMNWKQNAFERAAQLAENRVSKWKDGQGEPTLSQALRMAKLLGIPLVYLADDDLAEPPEAGDLNEDERLVLDLFHASGLDRRGVIELFVRREGRLESEEAKKRSGVADASSAPFRHVGAIDRSKFSKEEDEGRSASQSEGEDASSGSNRSPR